MRYIVFILIVVISTSNVYALPKYGVLIITSPEKDYKLKLVDTTDPEIYQLQVLHHGGGECAHYPFSGELISAYWSPDRKFVAINNHYGHGGTYVWIISLPNGSVITSHEITKNPNYDRYTDYGAFSNLVDKEYSKLKEINHGLDTDNLRNGYSSVAYGWTAENRLLMFHEFAFDNFFTKYGRIIQAFTTWNVTDRSVSLSSIWFRTARDDQDEPMPPEVRKTLNF